jgi:hypothetical protein
MEIRGVALPQGQSSLEFNFGYAGLTDDGLGRAFA